MVCIYCGKDTGVTNSRPQKRLHQVWRRRACKSCGAIFTTNETVDFSTSLVVRRPAGGVVPFNRDQLFVSVLAAVGHRDAPIADAGALTATITSKLLHGTNTAVVGSADIITAAVQVLTNFDKDAAVQYAAYHKPSKVKF
jgi:transcriptional regulator NrdR family protein